MTPRPLSSTRSPFEVRLRELMAKAGIGSYSALAAASGVSTDTIQRLCKGQRNLGMNVAKGLASALRCDINDLLT